MTASVLALARQTLHRRLIEDRVLAWRVGSGKDATPAVSTADRGNKGSRRVSELLAATLCQNLGLPGLGETTVADDNIGTAFARLVRDYVQATLDAMPSTAHPWTVAEKGSDIRHFAQYAHLNEIEKLARQYDELRPYFGTDYLVAPDIVVSRLPVLDDIFGDGFVDTDERLARKTFLRAANDNKLPLLHASVSCKWTMRSDRAQNVRTEALNMIRNRKGRVPAMTAVTAEPLPSRLASLAGGTGDLDRVYHVALYELEEAWDVAAEENPALQEQRFELSRMTNSLRLADISDLPFDLAI